MIAKRLNMIGNRQPPVSILPNFLCLPDLVVGIPVILAILRLALVIPNARFQLNDSPGIPVFERRLLAIFTLFFAIVLYYNSINPH